MTGSPSFHSEPGTLGWCLAMLARRAVQCSATVKGPDWSVFCAAILAVRREMAAMRWWVARVDHLAGAEVWANIGSPLPRRQSSWPPEPAAARQIRLKQQKETQGEPDQREAGWTTEQATLTQNSNAMSLSYGSPPEREACLGGTK